MMHNHRMVTDPHRIHLVQIDGAEEERVTKVVLGLVTELMVQPTRLFHPYHRMQDMMAGVTYQVPTIHSVVQ